MTPEIENAIKRLIEQITNTTKASDAINLTQAALNLAHTAQVLSQVNNK